MAKDDFILLHKIPKILALMADEWTAPSADVPDDGKIGQILNFRWLEWLAGFGFSVLTTPVRHF